jgi:hypothetical protein
MVSGRLLVSLFALAGLGAAAARGSDGTGDAMTRAARLLVSSLAEEQRARALFPLDDDQRFELRLAPVPEWGGLSLAEMGVAQVVLLHQLLGASSSAPGFEKATGILALEDHLVQGERQRGQVVPVHGIGRYSAAFFGDPAPGAIWGWRLQGHHLSLNFLVSPQGVQASAPAFLGAQPHLVAEGPRAGWRVLADEEDRGRALIAALDDQQRARARLADDMPRDMFAGARREYDLGEIRGIPYDELGADRQALLRELVETYLGNVPDAALRRRAAVERGGWSSVRFGFIGTNVPGERLYYRVHGPEFLLEYCAVAQSPNHVHTIWRERNGDFGRDLLAEHMTGSRH